MKDKSAEVFYRPPQDRSASGSAVDKPVDHSIAQILARYSACFVAQCMHSYVMVDAAFLEQDRPSIS